MARSGSWSGSSSRSWSARASLAAAALALSCTPQESAPPSPSAYAYPPPGAYPSNPPLQGPGLAPSPGSGVPAAVPSSSGPGSPGCGKEPAHKGASQQRVTALGRERAFTLVLPDGYAATVPYPLVFVLHGGGGNAALARTQTDLEKAAGGRAVFVYPDSVSGNWDLDAPTAQNRDVALFDAILLAAHNTLCVDERRVFVTGFSNGAYMANQLACKRGERIRAVATHAGGGPYETSGSYDATGHLVCPGKAVASLVVHGASDGTVPPAEGQKSIDHWSYANRCGSGTATAPALPSPCVALRGCFQPVSVCRIPGLGHGLWPQAGKATWQFFDALR